MLAAILALVPKSWPAWTLKAVGVAAAVVAVLFAVHSWDAAIRHRAVAETQLAQSTATLKVERKVAKITEANAVREATAQDVEKEKTRVIVQKVPRYVDRVVHVACVPWGLVRLHDAAAGGRDPDAVAAPGGQSDDACSPFKPADVAAVIAGNYGVARANAEQLDALEADVRQRIDAANGTGDKSNASH